MLLTASTAAPVSTPWLSAHLKASADAGDASTHPPTMQPPNVVSSVGDNHLASQYGNSGTIRKRLRGAGRRLEG